MRILCLALIFAALFPNLSKAEIDSMLASRINADPFAHAWAQYGEVAEIIKTKLNLQETAKFTFIFHTVPGIEKYSVRVRLCTKNGRKKCFVDEFPTLTFHNSQKQIILQDLSLINLKKETLIRMAELAKANNLNVVITVKDITSLHHSKNLTEVYQRLMNDVLREISFDFNELTQNHQTLEILPRQNNPFIEFQFHNKL